jgi:DNA-binding IclR family transcriptional regulator
MTEVATVRAADDSTSVVERVFQVLGALDPSGEPTALGLISERTSLPKPTVHRLLQQLIVQGAVERVGQHYRPGIRLFELGASVGRQQRLREVAMPFLEDLHQRVGNSIHLGVQHGGEVLYLEKISGPHRNVVNTRPGTRKPMHCTGLGKAMLAYSSTEVKEAIIARGLLPRTRYTITSRAGLSRQLAQVAEDGYALDREEHSLGVLCVAAPVFDAAGNASLALSVSGPLDAPAVQRSIRAVTQAAAGLATALGGRTWN